MILRRSNRYPIQAWNNCLSGHPVFVIGNGPSLLENDLSLLEGCFTIGINRIYKVFDPIILMWQDRGLMADGIENILDCSAIKVCRDRCDKDGQFTTFSLKGPSYKMTDRPNVLYGFGCSGVLGIELAVSMGASSVVLLGMDCDYQDGKTDFYGTNADHNRFTVKNFHSAMSWAAKNSPVPIYSCGRAPYWPRLSLSNILDLISPKRYGRLQWYDRLRVESAGLKA
jgi:hypothetical protein